MVIVDFRIIKVIHFAFTFNASYISSSELTVTKTSCRQVLHHSNRMDDTTIEQLSVVFSFQTSHNPCFTIVGFAKHYKITFVDLFSFEN